MRKNRQPRTFEVIVQRVGFKRASDVLLFAVQWGMVCAELGRDPENIEEYADWWKMSRATAFREQQRWRDALPEFSTPTEFFEAAGMDATRPKSITLDGLAFAPLPGVA